MHVIAAVAVTVVVVGVASLLIFAQSFHCSNWNTSCLLPSMKKLSLCTAAALKHFVLNAQWKHSFGNQYKS